MPSPPPNVTKFTSGSPANHKFLAFFYEMRSRSHPAVEERRAVHRGVEGGRERLLVVLAPACMRCAPGDLLAALERLGLPRAPQPRLGEAARASERRLRHEHERAAGRQRFGERARGRVERADGRKQPDVGRGRRGARGINYVTASTECHRSDVTGRKARA